MKKVLLIVAVALIGMVSLQAQKVGHIDVAKLVSEMPATIKAEATMKAESEKKQGELKKLEDALQAKVDAFKVKAQKVTSEAEQQALQPEYEGLQAEAKTIEDMRAKFGTALQEKQSELLQPIQDSALAAIEKVAAAKGLEYVIDSSLGVLVVAKGSDILADVKKELGIK